MPWSIIQCLCSLSKRHRPMATDISQATLVMDCCIDCDICKLISRRRDKTVRIDCGYVYPLAVFELFPTTSPLSFKQCLVVVGQRLLASVIDYIFVCWRQSRSACILCVTSTFVTRHQAWTSRIALGVQTIDSNIWHCLPLLPLSITTFSRRPMLFYPIDFSLHIGQHI